jgi:ribonuclease HI
MKGQVIADFMVDHAVVAEGEMCVVEKTPWSLYFDRSVCGKGQGVGCVIVSPNGRHVDLFVRLEFDCTNNKAEYEAHLYNLEYLKDMGVKDVNLFCDSKLVVQQMRGENQCLDGTLNAYRD